MARIRNAPSNSFITPRKRTYEGFPVSPSPKCSQESAPGGVYQIGTPTRKTKVHFGQGSRMFSGPSIVDPERRSQSPTRSALRKPAPQQDHGQFERDDEHSGPSAQLRDDLEQEMSPIKIHKPTRMANAGGPGGSANTKSKSSHPGPTFTVDTSGDDEDICKLIDNLKTVIWDFVKAFPPRPKKAKSDVLSQLIQPQNEQLIRYVGWTALAGGEGAEDWQKLLTGNDIRRAVVWGVIGKALKENVFDELYFGAWPELGTKLSQMEKEQSRQDGFYRQRARSDEISRQEAGRSRAEIDSALRKATARTALGLEILLLPLWCLGHNANEATWAAAGTHKTLFAIALAAANLARTMRRSRDVIYYWPPTLKDEEFEPARMECINLADMIRHSPYDRQEVSGRDRPILREGRANESQAIVRVVCFPGIQAYRQGGGDLAKRQLAAEREGVDTNVDKAPPDVVAMRRRIVNRYGEEYTGNEGLRTRIISKGVVLLQWGQQRLLTKEAGTSVHIDAVKSGDLKKYQDDVAGRVELFRLFEERLSSVRSSPVKVPQAQKSPSLFERIGSMLGGGEVERDEEGGEIARFSQQYRQREAEKRVPVAAPFAPRSRKGSRR